MNHIESITKHFFYYLNITEENNKNTNLKNLVTWALQSIQYPILIFTALQAAKLS